MKLYRSFLALTAVLSAGIACLPEDASAQERYSRRMPRRPAVQQNLPPPASPVLAVVGLKEQRITIYDSTGERMLEAPVSSGTTGYETPPGIFTVVQKNIDHRSNLYDDAEMPFMQRLTWTGIALHAGALPGYPASHGCVRLPYDFAGRLFDKTDIGMRVVIAREGLAPVPIASPAFFKAKAAVGETGSSDARPVQVASTDPYGHTPASDISLPALKARFAELELAAEDAGRTAKERRQAAARAKSAAQPAERGVRNAKTALDRAESSVKSADKAIEKAKQRVSEMEKKVAEGGSDKQVARAQKDLDRARTDVERAEKDQASAMKRLDSARADLAKAEGAAKAKLDALRQTETAMEQAAEAHAAAKAEAEAAKHRMSPVSVFISRATQRIYVRKGFHPLWEGPVAIRDADKPVGTFVFTANEPAANTRDVRWNVVSLYKNPTNIEPPTPRVKGAHQSAAELPLTDIAAAQDALDRISVPGEISRKISEIVLPGSSLIISDEPASIETGKDTDFVIVMSGEPQGALKKRKREPSRRSYDAYDDYYWGGGSSSSSRRRRSGGSSSGGGFFWFQ
ncbi:MAG: L,D-transpeptidase family protein [Hyphomicrobiaceae bacterium]